MVLRRIGRGEWSARGNAYGRRWIPPSRPTAQPPTEPQTLTSVAADSLSLSDLAAAIRAMLAVGSDAITFGDSSVADTIALLGIGEDSLTLSDASVAFINKVAAALDSVTLSDSAVGSQPGADPYAWFSGLDLGLIPFVVNEAAAPVTLTTVEVSTWAELETQAVLGARVAIMTASIDGGGGYITDPITDFDLVVPPGLALKNAGFGNIGTGETNCTRFRIRGETVGSTTSGGQIHHIDIVNPTDVIVEGLACSSLTDNSYSLYFRRFGAGSAAAARAAVHNCKAQCGSYWLLSDAADLVVANNSVMTGAEAPSVPGDATEAWGIRIGGPTSGHVVIFGNDIRSSSVRGAIDGHMRIRLHPNASACKVWINSNRLVNNSDGRMLWCHSAAGNSGIDEGDWQELYFEDNELYSDAAGVSIIIGDVVLARYRRNAHYTTNLTSDSQVSFGGGDSTAVSDGVKADNTYPGYSAPSGWWGPGDPTAIDWTP